MTGSPTHAERVRRNRERWCEALRSGKYTQGRNCLRRGDKFCCLGVALDLLDPDGWDRRRLPRWGRSGATMPEDVARHEYGLSLSMQLYLTTHNDGSLFASRHSFPEIASLIESLPIAPEGGGDE